MDETTAYIVEEQDWALTCIRTQTTLGSAHGMHDIDWDSIMVDETNNEEGRNDVTSE